MRFKVEIVSHPGEYNEFTWALDHDLAVEHYSQSEAEKLLKDTIIRLKAERVEKWARSVGTAAVMPRATSPSVAWIRLHGRRR